MILENYLSLYLSLYMRLAWCVFMNLIISIKNKIPPIFLNVQLIRQKKPQSNSTIFPIILISDIGVIHVYNPHV